jgi:hypothetical protein
MISAMTDRSAAVNESTLTPVNYHCLAAIVNPEKGDLTDARAGSWNLILMDANM